MRRDRDPLIAELAWVRARTGMTQTELASRLGIAKSNVSEWESGNISPRLSTIRRWADALGADLKLVLR